MKQKIQISLSKEEGLSKMNTILKQRKRLLPTGPIVIPLLLCFVFLSITAGQAQGTKEDYQRATFIRQKMENNIFYAPKTFQWLENENKFYYLNSTPTGRHFILVDINLKSKTPAFDQVKLAAGLSLASGKNIEAFNLPFTEFSFVENGKAIEFAWEGDLWRTDLLSYKCMNKGKRSPALPTRIQDGDEPGNRSVNSPDGKWYAFIKNYNVYIQSAVTREDPVQLSFDGSAGEFYSSNIQWAPDSRKLATNKIRPNRPHLVYLIESSPEDQLQPKLHSRNYLKPGDALPQKQPSLFIVSTGKQIQVDPNLINSQYNVSDPVWRKDSRSFTFEYNQRGSQIYEILEVDASTGVTRELVKEGTKTFINNRKKYRFDVTGTDEIIWASERDGWNHLYLYDAITGKVKNQITKGGWVVRSVVKVNESTRTIIFEASGREAGRDPYLIQIYKINFDGSGLQNLTPEDANHLATFSPDYSCFVDSYSRINLPPVTVLRSTTDGNVLMELEKADAKELIRA
ncbi:MAG TPA: DPP IV N-terminal domain-containing protein, partial [Flavitalea sp.]|nr:DPP IV N-terminal domain-containing protein [Flavitalea sp.]